MATIILFIITLTYWLAYNIKSNNQHIFALSLFLSSISFYGFIITLKIIYHHFNTGFGPIILDNHIFMIIRLWLVIMTGCYFIHTSWKSTTQFINNK